MTTQARLNLTKEDRDLLAAFAVAYRALAKEVREYQLSPSCPEEHKTKGSKLYSWISESLRARGFAYHGRTVSEICESLSVSHYRHKDALDISSSAFKPLSWTLRPQSGAQTLWIPYLEKDCRLDSPMDTGTHVMVFEVDGDWFVSQRQKSKVLPDTHTKTPPADKVPEKQQETPAKQPASTLPESHQAILTAYNEAAKEIGWQPANEKYCACLLPKIDMVADMLAKDEVTPDQYFAAVAQYAKVLEVESLADALDPDHDAGEWWLESLALQNIKDSREASSRKHREDALKTKFQKIMDDKSISESDKSKLETCTQQYFKGVIDLCKLEEITNGIINLYNTAAKTA